MNPSKKQVRQAVQRATSQRHRDDHTRRPLLHDQDLRLLAVLGYEPTPGYVANAQFIGVTFRDDRESRGRAHDGAGRFRKKAA